MILYCLRVQICSVRRKIAGCFGSVGSDEPPSFKLIITAVELAVFSVFKLDLCGELSSLYVGVVGAFCFAFDGFIGSFAGCGRGRGRNKYGSFCVGNSIRTGFFKGIFVFFRRFEIVGVETVFRTIFGIMTPTVLCIIQSLEVFVLRVIIVGIEKIT